MTGSPIYLCEITEFLDFCITVQTRPSVYCILTLFNASIRKLEPEQCRQTDKRDRTYYDAALVGGNDE